MVKSCEDIIRMAQSGKRNVISVAAAHDEAVIKAVVEAKKLGIADATLCGFEDTIRDLLVKEGEDPSDYNIIGAASNEEAAALAVREISEKRADYIMKGIISTSGVMRAVLNKEANLRTDHLLSHCMFYDVPGFGRLLCDTDGGMNTYPDLEKKAGILENAAILCKALGYDRIYASCVCGAEDVNPKIQATVDADELSKMEDRWSRYNMHVEGPMGFDLAISPEACAHKGYRGEGGGKADILLVPTYEVGNGIGKTLTYFAGAHSAGVVVGAKVPVVLVSRADDAYTKLCSIALGAVASKAEY